MKKLSKLLFLVALTLPVIACNNQSDKFEVKEIEPYFYQVGKYTSLDYDFAQNYFAKERDNWGGGCSAISKVVDGSRLIGRNMDLNISNKCAYYVETKLPGKYQTLGLSYTFRDVSPNYADVKANGLGETWEKILPFMCDDVMNTEGLHIELNMRHGEKDAQGNDKFAVEHTNKNCKNRIYVFSLCQYLALNCKDINDCKNYLDYQVDVYSQKDYWNYCFLISDAKGDSVLLEFGNGGPNGGCVHWVEPDANGVVAQTNFYVNSICNNIEDIKTGLGRYDSMMAGIASVKNKADMFNLMNKVSFSWLYAPYATCKAEHFDPRSEVIGEEMDPAILEYLYEQIMGVPYTGQIPIGTNEAFIMAEENEAFISIVLDSMHEEYNSMTRAQRQDKNEYWESSFTEVVDPKNKTIEVRLFENSSMMYKLSFDGIQKITEIK